MRISRIICRAVKFSNKTLKVQQFESIGSIWEQKTIYPARLKFSLPLQLKKLYPNKLKVHWNIYFKVYIS